MRRVLLLLPVFLLSLTCTRAYADTIFNLKGTLQDGVGKFEGTLTYEPQYNSFGRVTGTITDGAYSFTVPANYLGETIDENTITHVDVFGVLGNFDLSLYVPNSFRSSNASGSLCSLDMPCTAFNVVSSFYDFDPTGTAGFPLQSFQTLTATPQVAPQVTPEPSSLFLLGTGVVGVAAGLRRRYSVLRG